LQFGEFLTLIRDIPNLLNPNTVTDTAYLRYLGYLIGVVFPPEDETSTDEMQKTLSEAVDWYRLKGTYRALAIIAHISNFTINIYDMYTNDYADFISMSWFVGDENENPPGLDNSYYKSPHFGVEILLNKVYTGTSGESAGGIYSYLWQPAYLNNLLLQVEEVRPVHTVPHFLILLNPQTDEFGHIIEVEGDIRTQVTVDWQFGTKYFDMNESGTAWNFDEGVLFDESEESFIKSITKFVLGTGDAGLGSSFVSIKEPVFSGSIDPDDITILSDRYRFEFIVPKGTKLSSISELGLYVPGTPDVLVLASTFPKITKDDRISLKVVVEVFKKDLSI
jgi:hypothetical protein